MKKNTQPGASRSKIKDTTTDRVFYIFNLIVWLIGMDPSGCLKEVMERVQSTIFFSATLLP